MEGRVVYCTLSALGTAIRRKRLVYRSICEDASFISFLASKSVGFQRKLPLLRVCWWKKIRKKKTGCVVYQCPPCRGPTSQSGFRAELVLCDYTFKAFCSRFFFFQTTDNSLKELNQDQPVEERLCFPQRHMCLQTERH